MERAFKILVIDDEEDLRENLKYVLKMKGYEVALAEDGLQGLKKLETFEPDLIILDMNMPRMGGVEFYEKIFDGISPKFPVFVLTARANMEQLFKELKVEGFMSKPFEIDDFLNEVDIIVKKRAPGANDAKEIKKRALASIYLVDDNPAEAGPIVMALLSAGYRVAYAKSGIAALEMMAQEPPVLGLVKLGLPDIAGDLVALRALNMAKTSSVKFMLFEKRDARHSQSVRQQIGSKSGVVALVEYDNPEDILLAVNAVIKKLMDGSS